MTESTGERVTPAAPDIVTPLDVLNVPVPSAFVKSKTSPTRAPAFDHTRDGFTNPVTDKPNFIVSSSIVWPPTNAAPDSAIASEAPCRTSTAIDVSNVALLFQGQGFHPIGGDQNRVTKPP